MSVDTVILHANYANFRTKFAISAAFARSGDKSNYRKGVLHANKKNSLYFECCGRVRFPSGRMQSYLTHYQGVPVKGGQYLLFLKRVDQTDVFTLLTGYEYRGARVYPLDGVDLGAGATEIPQFTTYKGVLTGRPHRYILPRDSEWRILDKMPFPHSKY